MLQVLMPTSMTAGKVMSPQAESKSFDDLTRYVRIRSKQNSAFVEFDFAIGHPELFVELVLPRQAFEIFCMENNVVHMDSKMIRQIDEDMVKWRFGERGQRY